MESYVSLRRIQKECNRMHTSGLLKERTFSLFSVTLLGYLRFNVKSQLKCVSGFLGAKSTEKVKHSSHYSTKVSNQPIF